MAAPMVSDVRLQQRTIRGKIQKKSPGYKNVLLDPHPSSWPVIGQKEEIEILEKMKSVFTALELGRTTPVKPIGSIPGESRLAQKKRRREIQLARKEENDKQREKEADEGHPRSQVVFGINNVVRCLERGELRLVTVGGNVHHSLRKMTQHLIPLCASRGCPAVCVSQLQTHIAPVLSVNSLLALGIKNRKDGDSSALDDLVKYVSKRCPPLDVHWLTKTNCSISHIEASTISLDSDTTTTKKDDDKLTNKQEKNCQQFKLSKMSDFSDLYVFKNSDAKSKPLDFIQFDATDQEEDEIISYILPKSSKTREVNPRTSCPAFVGQLTSLGTPKPVCSPRKRKLPENEEKSSKFTKAKIKHKKANPNKAEKKRKKKKLKKLS